RFHLQELALRGIGRRGLDAAETIGDESHDGGASFQALESARKVLAPCCFRKATPQQGSVARAISRRFVP
ncbi:MAG TPA: hypothetical protein VEX61_06730, partial [Burkholderiales bacterium]|nr:hypothetical protein [Burkholderiales bacterium]